MSAVGTVMLKNTITFTANVLISVNSGSLLPLTLSHIHVTQGCCILSVGWKEDTHVLPTCRGMLPT